MNRLREAFLSIVAVLGAFLPALFVAGPAEATAASVIVRVQDTNIENLPQPYPMYCGFSIQFANAGTTTAVSIQATALKPGTTVDVRAGDLTPTVNGDPAGGPTDVDANEVYQPAFTGTPDPQGFPVRYTITIAEGSDVSVRTFTVDHECAPYQRTWELGSTGACANRPRIDVWTDFPHYPGYQVQVGGVNQQPVMGNLTSWGNSYFTGPFAANGQTSSSESSNGRLCPLMPVPSSMEDGTSGLRRTASETLAWCMHQARGFPCCRLFLAHRSLRVSVLIDNHCTLCIIYKTYFL